MITHWTDKGMFVGHKCEIGTGRGRTCYWGNQSTQKVKINSWSDNCKCMQRTVAITVLMCFKSVYWAKWARGGIVPLQHLSCRQFDKESEVALGTHAHFTRSDVQDVARVTSAVISNNLLQISLGKTYSAYRIKLDPLWNWDKKKIVSLHPVKQRHWRVQTVLENWSKAHLETILFRPCYHWDPYYTRFLTTLSHRNFLIV